MGRFVHGSVLTVVGQDSMPLSTLFVAFGKTRRLGAEDEPQPPRALF